MITIYGWSTSRTSGLYFAVRYARARSANLMNQQPLMLKGRTCGMSV